MHRARNQLLACARLSVDQHRRIGRRHGLHLVQNAPQCLALADDLFELQLAANLVFQVQLFERELVLQVGNFSERHGVFHRNGYLVRHLREKRKVVRRKRIFPVRAERQHACRAAPPLQGSVGQRLQFQLRR